MLTGCGKYVSTEQLQWSLGQCKNNLGVKEVYIDTSVGLSTREVRCNDGAIFSWENFTEQNPLSD
jgi:hypothetical protein